MNSAKKRRLQKAGWRVGSAEEFLGLSREEAELVEMKLALGLVLKRHRTRKRLTQAALQQSSDRASPESRSLSQASRGHAGSPLPGIVRRWSNHERHRPGNPTQESPGSVAR